MTHFTAFQKPYEHNTLLSFDNIVLSNHGVCVYEKLTRSKRGVLLPRAMPLKYAFRRYLRRFGTAENILKTMSLKHEFWPLMVVETDWNCRRNENNVSKAYILTVFETIWNCREKHENNVSKACILTVFETIWNCRENYENIGVRAFWAMPNILLFCSMFLPSVQLVPVDVLHLVA